VLAIDSLLAETIQQFVEGVTDTHKGSEARVKRFLKGTRFQPNFDHDARKAFYLDIGCGLLHQAEAKRIWLIRAKTGGIAAKVAVPDGQRYILDVERFNAGLQGSLNDYLTSISVSQPIRSYERTFGRRWTIYVASEQREGPCTKLRATRKLLQS
jgi:hypothetical protein